MSAWEDIDHVKEVVQHSLTRCEVLEKLGLSPTTMMYRRLQKFERDYSVSTSHFRPHHSNKQKNRALAHRSLTNEDIFRKGSETSGRIVKRRLLADKLIEYKCTSCGNEGKWLDKKLCLQLEHKDGDPTNNLLENLCFLCPNCHSQTATYCGKNVKKNDNQKKHYRGRKAVSIERNQPLVDKVLQSGIDFSKHGWSRCVALLLNKQPQKVKAWMMRYMPDFYITKCFHRQGVLFSKGVSMT